jgi:hypothetical protein
MVVSRMKWLSRASNVPDLKLGLASAVWPFASCTVSVDSAVSVAFVVNFFFAVKQREQIALSKITLGCYSRRFMTLKIAL